MRIATGVVAMEWFKEENGVMKARKDVKTDVR
jgi:hypothetical protein